MIFYDIFNKNNNQWKENNGQNIAKRTNGSRITEKSDFNRSVNRPLQLTTTTYSLRIVFCTKFRYPWRYPGQEKNKISGVSKNKGRFTFLVLYYEHRGRREEGDTKIFF